MAEARLARIADSLRIEVRAAEPPEPARTQTLLLRVIFSAAGAHRGTHRADTFVRESLFRRPLSAADDRSGGSRGREPSGRQVPRVRRAHMRDDEPRGRRSHCTAYTDLRTDL